MPLSFSDINKGDKLFEYAGSRCVEVYVSTQPEKIGDQWRFVGIVKDKEVEYLQTEGSCSYGPKLYNYQAYTNCT